MRTTFKKSSLLTIGRSTRIMAASKFVNAGPSQEKIVCNFFASITQWQGLRSIVMVTGQRQLAGKTSTQTRYYISSMANDAEKILHAARSHWGIENSLHWVLDVAMKEDDSAHTQGQCTSEYEYAATHCLKPAQARKDFKTVALRQTPAGQL